MLAKALVAAGGASASPAAVADALRGYEAERVARAMPVTVKSHIMGAMLQIRFPGVRHSWGLGDFNLGSLAHVQLSLMSHANMYLLCTHLFIVR